jgi:hypothetical protein
MCEGRQQATETAMILPCAELAIGEYVATCARGHLRRNWLCRSHVSAPSVRGTLCWECHEDDGAEIPMGPRVRVDA